MEEQKVNIHAVEQSNPFSTGGGGTNFEISVQSYFVGCMIMGWKIPGIKDGEINKIKLQGRYAGYDVDDCIIFGKNGSKLLCQIKHSIRFTKNDSILGEVIKAAWNDFNNDKIFNINTDTIALVLAGISKTDYQNTIIIFEWARTCEDEKEFLDKLYKHKFSSEKKIEKYEMIKYHLENANRNPVNDAQIWLFLKKFMILNLELDIQEGVFNLLIDSVLEKFSGEKNFASKLYYYVANMNQNAGTILLESVKKDLNIENKLTDTKILNDYEKIKSHNDLILDNMRNKVAGITINRKSEVEKILTEIKNNNIILITGERGVGKSGIIKEFKDGFCVNKYCLIFRAEELDKPHFQNVLSDMGVNSTFEELNQSLSLYDEKYLFIESLEKVLETDNTKAFCDLLSLVSKEKGWKIIATVRNYAIQQIIMNFITVYFLNYKTIEVERFNEKEIQEFIDKIDVFKSVKTNIEILELIRNPFYLECIYKTLCSGFIVTEKDTKNTIKSAIWDIIVSKNHDRTDGLPKRRTEGFIQIALRRAKTMKYAIDEDEFNEIVLQKLEEDGLLVRDNGFVCLSHDVFEDWALERYIEKAYNVKKDIKSFLENIGCEQSICRAYRLWLDSKFGDESFIRIYIKDFFNEKNLRSIWYDETIAAIIFSNKLESFLFMLDSLLFSENCSILKRICFNIRVSAKRPNLDLANFMKVEKGVMRSSLINLKPYGDCWNQIIEFLYIQREKLPEEMYIHCSYILDEWSNVININCSLPKSSKEAGLLALFIIDKTKERYSNKDLNEKLFSVAMMTFNSISDEFRDFIENTVFDNEKRDRYRYIDNLAKQMHSGINCGFIAKYDPDLLIRVAKREWLLREQPDNVAIKMMNIHSSIDMDEQYGLNSSSIRDYFPPSGEREPFRSLFKFEPKKAIDFVIEICNITAENYINSNFENKKEILNGIKCELKEEGGNNIQQYVIGNFWGAYRGIGNVPYLIKSALMALENWLLIHFEAFKENKNELDYVINYLLSNSNSVLVTAVVSSVAIPYYKNIGESVLLILQDNNFYSMDIERSVHEMGGNEINWFSMNTDAFRSIYIEDRRKAAMLKWRNETLENLCIKLQFTELRQKVLKILDDLNNKFSDDVEWRFRINRLDTRKFKIEYDEDTDGMTIISGEVKEKDLVEISNETMKKSRIMNRFARMMNWTNDALLEKVKFDTYKDSEEIYEEIRKLIPIYHKLPKEQKIAFFERDILRAVCILYRDFRNLLNEEKVKWCKDFIINKFITYDNSLNYITVNGKLDNTGMWTVAEILPLLSEFITEKQLIEILIRGITCCDIDVRFNTAKGIRKYIWNINEKIADKCIYIARYFDGVDTQKQNEIMKLYYQADRKTKDNYCKWLCEIRKELNNTKKIQDIIEKNISLDGMTMIMLMLNPKYNERYKQFLSESIVKITLAERKMNDYRDTDDRKIENYYKVVQFYSEFIAKYLYELENKDLEHFKENLEGACQDAPNFMRWTLINYQVLAEKDNNIKKFWYIWKLLFKKMQKISEYLNIGENYKYDKKCEILREYMYVNKLWQPVDFENPPIREGIVFLCEFTKKSSNNPIVFEGITSLMYNFPELILEKGLITLENLSEDEMVINMKKSRNSIFYLENILHSYIINMESKTMHSNLYNTCDKALNGLIRMASPKAYYIREHLIKSKRII